MVVILHKIHILIQNLIFWIYNDADNAFGTGGFIGAGFIATMSHLNYWYWAKVIVSAIIGGVVNILVKRLFDIYHPKQGGKNNGQ
jgi:hypothetical protein